MTNSIFEIRLIFGKQYINAPSEDEIINKFLVDIISEIGSKHGVGRGSPYSKGIRVIKYRVGCSSTSIKLMAKAVKNTIIRDIQNDSRYVFRFNIKAYSEIFFNIVEWMIANGDSLDGLIKNEYEKVKLAVPNPKRTYSELLIRNPLISLDNVIIHGRNHIIRTQAISISNQINDKDQKHGCT